MPTPESRAAYLQVACGGDVVLRRKIDQLLKEHFSDDSLLAGSAREAERTTKSGPPAPEAPAQTIGRYKLLERIGEGGFGEVWMAEQREPVKRRVALKIIKPGMDSRQIVARFEAERQALAMMDHANIAKIFDAGTTDNGRPYFVMELVRGTKITEYCDQKQMPTRERLNLFVLVCQAIQHAHQKGIIHRDIKPSNILVTQHDGVPVPKVIDFGIAKATQQELTDKTVFTQFQQFMGTPAYISPEQAEMSGLDIHLCKPALSSDGMPNHGHFFHDQALIKDTNVVLAVAVTRVNPNVIITTRVLDKENNDAVLYERSVVDTPAVDRTLTEEELEAASGMHLHTGQDVGAPMASGTDVILTVFQYNDGTRPAAEVTYDNLERWTYIVPDWQPGIAVKVLSSIPPQVNLTLAAEPNSTWAIDRALELTGPWTNPGTMLIGPGGSGELHDSDSPSPAGFYRARPQE